MICIRSSLPRLGTQFQRTGTRWFARTATKASRTGVKEHWTSETLRTTEKYPLSLELCDKANPLTEEATRRRPKVNPRGTKKKKSATTQHARPQIVSPDLCDDVLSYYGKSLEIHKGCDILDINPGAGLWSQKLHDWLQPRSHVLLEPNPDRYKTFLDPLLNAPGSKYKLVQKDTNELEHYTQLIDEGVFTHQTRVDRDDAGRQELNPTLLVTGMLVWDPVLPGMAFDSMAKQLYHLFSAAVRTNDQFHAYGRVRTLFWVGSDDFRNVIADTMATFNKANCILEMTQSMDIVVNAPRTSRGTGKAASGRDMQYEIESVVKALQRGKESGMTLPAHREDTIHKIAAEIDQLSEGSGRTSYAWLHDYLLEKYQQGITPVGLLNDATLQHHDHAIALQKKYPDIDFEAMGNAKNAKVPRQRSFWTGRQDHPAREEAHNFSITKSADRALIAKKMKLEALADVGEQLYHAECSALRTQDGTEEKAKLLERITELDTQWGKLLNATAANYKAVPASIVDDRICLRAPPYPRIQWDRRPFEPLTMSPEEAWPPHRLALISSTPHARPAGQTTDYYEWAHDFIHALFTTPSLAISDALEKMQHGLSQIVESCPSITDPDKGGRMLMKHFRVRMLTSEMIDELVTAYRDWPFKAPGSDHNKYFRWKGQVNAPDIGAR
ncbi:hypothetical protein OPT61_g10282 [Boeremia exigua]|uniref:Uncharacterized protein n=1 Tax=Boeremia exigua TaxID=749465 RepID=A0ACC2HR77_9PLEO|nr:hypothetical protein OPT61_g10282 [Boeremia exigua]